MGLEAQVRRFFGEKHMNKQEQSKRLYQAIERLALQAGEDTDETIDWLCGEHGGMTKLFEKYFSPTLQHPREWVGLTDEEIDELHGSPMELEHSGALEWVRIIEAKLKEKNG
jgi:hypothetical protein